MTISESSLSHALHGVGHSAHTRTPASRAQSFTQQLAAAKAGKGPGETKSSATPGALLSTDMMQAAQTIR